MNAISTTASAPAEAERPEREVMYRHTFLVRLTHWINALTIFVMIGTGLSIFNAHPRLYWGFAGSYPDHPWLWIHAASDPHGKALGLTQIGPLVLDTTGVLGLSRFHGAFLHRAWPGWVTIPSYQDLASARHWHLFFAWLLVSNGALYLLWSFARRHVQRDLWPTLGDLRSIPRSIADHVRLKHATGEAAKRYNPLQRLAYLGLITLVIGMVLTGLTMSPGVDAAWPFLLDLFGGRQSARSLHFLFAFLIFMFIVVHLVEVVLAGPLNEVGSMITGRWAVPSGHPASKPETVTAP